MRLHGSEHFFETSDMPLPEVNTFVIYKPESSSDFFGVVNSGFRSAIVPAIPMIYTKSTVFFTHQGIDLRHLNHVQYNDYYGPFTSVGATAKEMADIMEKNYITTNTEFGIRLRTSAYVYLALDPHKISDSEYHSLNRNNSLKPFYKSNRVYRSLDNKNSTVLFMPINRHQPEFSDFCIKAYEASRKSDSANSIQRLIEEFGFSFSEGSWRTYHHLFSSITKENADTFKLFDIEVCSHMDHPEDRSEKIKKFQNWCDIKFTNLDLTSYFDLVATSILENVSEHILSRKSLEHITTSAFKNSTENHTNKLAIRAG